MKVFIEKDKKTVEFNENMTGEELLSKLGIDYSTAILVKNNEVILAEDKIKKDDEVKILSVISGG